jgi:hypothetical protein
MKSWMFGYLFQNNLGQEQVDATANLRAWYVNQRWKLFTTFIEFSGRYPSVISWNHRVASISYSQQMWIILQLRIQCRNLNQHADVFLAVRIRIPLKRSRIRQTAGYEINYLITFGYKNCLKATNILPTLSSFFHNIQYLDLNPYFSSNSPSLKPRIRRGQKPLKAQKNLDNDVWCFKNFFLSAIAVPAISVTQRKR